MLGVVARDNQVVRLRDLREHPAHRGFPPGHPDMRSFLGVPITRGGRSVGNLYLAEKRGAAEFTEQDQRLVEMLAARASIAIETASLYRAEGLERAWLQAVVNQMPEAIVLMDAEGHVHTRNAAARLWFCDDLDELDPFGNPVMFDVRGPDGARMAAAELPIVRAVLHDETIVGQELSLRAKDGSLISVLASAAPVHDAEAKVLGATMVMLDVSPLRALERLREEWSSIVAHDLRQPLNGIALSAQILAQMTPDDPDHAGVTERIRAAALRLNRMVDDLLDTSRIEAGQMTVEPREVDLAVLVREVLARVPDLAARCEVHVGPAARVFADPGRVEQVLLNLVSNAAKYGEAGTPIEIELVARNEDVEVRVKNRGRRIPPEEMPSLFHRFARLQAARKSAAPGLGLGLHICRGLVEAQGGKIWAESVPGRTTFHFTLPRREPRAIETHGAARGAIDAAVR